MNFKYFYLLLVILQTSNLFAQKARYDGESIGYIQYPLKPLPKELKKYSISHEGFDMNQTIGKNNGFSLKNYEKVTKGEDFKIKVKFSPVNVDIRTERFGNTTYSLFFVTFDAHVEITNPDNSIIDTIVISKIENVMYRRNGPYPDDQTALTNAAGIKQSITAEVFREADLKSDEIIKSNIDLVNKKINLKPGSVKDDAELTGAAQKFNEQVLAIGVLKFDGTDKVNKEELSKIASIWEKRSASLGPVNKENESLHQMYKYNLALANFLSGDYAKAKENIADAMKGYLTLPLMAQLKLAHIYNLDELLKAHEARLKNNGLL